VGFGSRLAEMCAFIFAVRHKQSSRPPSSLEVDKTRFMDEARASFQVGIPVPTMPITTIIRE
jgi:hypothetical protein